MAVEIKELVIRAVTDSQDAEARQQPQQGPQQEDEGHKELVEACVREVLKILRRSKER